jgi:tetratricopeptide (TPR) repeat protein
MNKADTKTLAHSLKGMMAGGDYASARAAIETLLQRRPRLPQAWQALGQLLDVRAIRQEDVGKMVKQVLSKDPENSLAHEWNALQAVEQADSPESPLVNEAHASLEEAIKFSDRPGRLYRLLAQLASCRGDLDGGIATLKEGAKASPHNAQFLFDLAIIHMRMGAHYFGSAISNLEEMPQRVGGQGKHILLAYLYAFLGQNQRASKAFEDYLKAGPGEPELQEVQLHAAHLALIKEAKEEAVRIAEEALGSRECPPDRADYANWCEFFVCAEDNERAIEIRTGIKDRVVRGDSWDALTGRPRDYSSDALGALAVYLRDGTPAGEEAVLREWKDVEDWTFKELLILRERMRRKGKTAQVQRLAIIERLIQRVELRAFSGQAFFSMFADVRMGARRLPVGRVRRSRRTKA